MQNIEAFHSLLAIPRQIIITMHQNPDADALGSALGLAAYLSKKNHQVKVISPTDYPQFLHWMQGNDQVMVYNDGHQEAAAQLIQQADVIFCLDFSSLNRISDMGDLVRASDAVRC